MTLQNVDDRRFRHGVVDSRLSPYPPRSSGANSLADRI